MFAVLARFQATEAYKDQFLPALDRSLEITQKQPGFLACHLLSPRKENNTRVCVMLWESRGEFQTFLKSDDSKRGHADVRPEFFSEPPGLEELDVLGTWHAPSGSA